MTTQTAGGTGTQAAQLRSDERVRAGVRQIVEAVREHSAKITDVRPARGELKQDYDELMARVAEVRGRGLLYPYIGSGLGNGALVELADGSVKWDMICGIGVNFFGHSDPELIEAAAEASLDDVIKHGNLQMGEESHLFGETLVGAARQSSHLRHAFLTTGGALANENALKLCYHKHAPASRVICFQDCFMGRTVTMANLGDEAAYRVGIPLTTPVDYMPFYDPIAAKRMGEGRYIDMCVMHLEQYIDRYPGQHAAFVFEFIQGEGGFNVAPREFFTALMDVCRDKGIAIWDDEIQTFGRTTSLFCYEWLDLGEYIDVLTVGKMTQACATLFTERYNPQPGLLSGTFTGESVSFRVGRRIIERLRDGDAYGEDGRHARHHRLFVEQVRALAKKHPQWFGEPQPKYGGTNADDIVGGKGGMMRFTPFGGEKAKVVAACKACFEEGVVLFWCGHDPYHVRMLPPLGVMKEEDWPRVFACVERGLAKAAS